MPTPGGIIPQIRAQRDIYEKARVLLCKIDWFSANGLPGVANKGTFSTGTYQMQGRVLPLPLELQEMLNSYLGSTHLWPAKRNLALKMKQLPPQFVSILAIYCFCMLQIPSSGFPRPLADPPDDLDIMQLEWLAYGATLSWQTKFPPVHPLMSLAAQLANRRMKRFQQQRDSRTDAGDFTKKDHTATLGRPFFLFRPRNGRNTEANTQ
ncbi:neuromedin-S isoform X1 [Neofelis nebulosa]|uniref:neuromedin-S isoform X1 n=1 Tax=Neofelis nebulosa TaxID=61452 RepID=UPI00272C64A0|nr:neuromedin-S isoform X1 [Neofelis nebulosa]XP_058540421.1 neuromedin-S isoform X1 [Neofelis nebulosa]XP_058540422.1 neuromedin-S isoform X1 [Neofelis nebulosa]